jgi:predicted dehydrogenase
MIRAGVVGYGYWGPNLVRNLAEAPDCQVAAICDCNQERLAVARRRVPGAATTTRWEDLVQDPRIDAVAVATPVSTHFEIAMEALRAGKHVLLEKPMAATADQAMRLIDEAERRRLTLMVDHTFVFTGAVRKIRETIEAGGLGEIYYYDSVRVNLGLFRSDVNVIWDLAAHDFSIVDYLLAQRPCAISATGMIHVSGGVENIAWVTAFFQSPLIVHLGLNWLAPVKVRQTLIGGSEKMIVYDDLEPSEKVKIYHKGITVDSGVSPESLYGLRIGYRTGDMWAPKLDTTEALRTATLHFLECIETGRKPITGGCAGLRVVRLLEAATHSLRHRGLLVELGGESLPA